MTLLLSILAVIALPSIGGLVSWFAPGPERRWAEVVPLTLALLALLVGTLVHGGEAQDNALGLTLDPLSLTIAPALLLARLLLVLASGRRDSASRLRAGFDLILSLELFALFTHSPLLLIGAEFLSAALLISQVWRGGLRTQALYLGAQMALLIAGALTLNGAQSFAELSETTSLILVLAGLLRIGVFPMTSGILSSLSRKLDTTSLAAALPSAGVLLLLRAGATLSAQSSELLQYLLLVAAPAAAALSIAQRRLPRSFAYLMASASALIALGSIDVGPAHVASGGLLWAGTLLAGAGLGVVAYLVTVRVGEKDLGKHSGLRGQMPFFSLMFLLFGVAIAGVPGTQGFVAEEVLLNSSSLGTDGVGLIAMTIALMGFSVIRMHFRLFYGAPLATAPLPAKGRERIGLLLVALVVFLGGVLPGLRPLLSGG